MKALLGKRGHEARPNPKPRLPRLPEEVIADHNSDKHENLGYLKIFVSPYSHYGWFITILFFFGGFRLNFGAQIQASFEWVHFSWICNACTDAGELRDVHKHGDLM